MKLAGNICLLHETNKIANEIASAECGPDWLPTLIGVSVIVRQSFGAHQLLAQEQTSCGGCFSDCMRKMSTAGSRALWLSFLVEL